MPTVSPWKQDFPIFSYHAHPNLCYLDSAATCLTPKHVADAMFHYQCFSHANSHKGLYQLSANVTEIVEQARDKVANFLGAESANNIVFNSGTTEALNLIAYSFVEPILMSDCSGRAKNIVISAVEHHANLLPWQRLAKQYDVELRIAPIDDFGDIDLAMLATLLDENTAVLAFTHCSNVIGKFTPVGDICRLAKSKNIPTIIDGAQAVAHGPVNVKNIGCDFYVFSAHKLYGPTGCGILYCRSELLEQMRPYQLGGGMINSVDFTDSDYISGPLKLEPGSHNVASIVGLVEAIDYLNDISWSDISLYMNKLNHYLSQSLIELNYFKPIISAVEPSQTKGGKSPSLISFELDSVHCHDVASLLDSENIAVRAGHHCAQPLHKSLGINASIRVSLGLYNGYEDIDRLITSLHGIHQLMATK